MPTLGDDRVLVRFSADDASKRDGLQQLLLLLVLVVLGRLARAFPLGYDAAPLLFALGIDFPVAIQLPSLFVILTGMKEFTRIPEATLDMYVN